MMVVRNSNWGAAGLVAAYLTWVSGQATAAPQEIDIGGLLKQAETACLQGDTVRLNGLSQQIRTLAQQPALQSQQVYLDQLLTLYQAGICQPEKKTALSGGKTLAPISASTNTTHVQVSAGYLDNVNQGSRHERITIINPFNGLLVEGRLDERNLPLSTPFVGAQGTYRMTRDGGRKMVALTASRQEYTDQPDFSTTSFAISGQEALEAGKEVSAYLNLVRDDKGNEEQRIGGIYYHPLAASTSKKTGVISGLEYITYPKQDVYKALVANVALEHHKALSKGGEVGIQGRMEIDHALEQRPGGDRREVELSGQWTGKQLVAGWQPSAGIRVAYKLDAKPFDPKLYGDSTRTQISKGIDLGMGKKIGDNKKLQISYQYGQTQDKEVPLFDQPAGSAVGITFETNF